jgi:CheY-like chemotaxis protein
MINRIIFKKTLNHKPSEDSGLRSVNGVVLNRSEELFCLPGSFSEKSKSNGYNKKVNRPDAEHQVNGSLKPSSKQKVLHVEDDPNLRMLLTLLLKKDFEVISVSNGEKAIELVAKSDTSFDIIFMDVDLGPGLNGIQTAAKLREVPLTQTTPIIALTGNNYHDIREECMKAGLNAYIQKPFQKADLLQTISDLKSN